MSIGWVGRQVGRLNGGVAVIQSCMPKSSELAGETPHPSATQTERTGEIVACNRLVMGDQYFEGPLSEKPERWIHPPKVTRLGHAPDRVPAYTANERAIAPSGTTPRRIITDKAGAYPPALAAVAPDGRHRTGRYRTNAIERDHGFSKV
jgi:hypothetical protein